MNYIWDVLLQADKEEIPRKDIVFELAKCYSPYMEVNFNNINTTQLGNDLNIEINPYYRFYSIFKDLFLPDDEEMIELRNVLTDILMHYLGEVDLKQGLYKREYYINFIARDLCSGTYGDEMAAIFRSLDKVQQNVILEGILQLYTTGMSLLIFKKVISSIFKKSATYQKNDIKDELLIYIGERKNEMNVKKLQMICEFFLPLHTKYVVYWEKHFCILGINETAVLNEIALY